MSHGKCEPTNTNAADYKLYARFDAGETLESVLASPPTTKHNKVTSEGNIRTEHRMWILGDNYPVRIATITLACL